MKWNPEIRGYRVLLAYFSDDACLIKPIRDEREFDEVREYYARAIDCRGIQFFDNIGDRVYPERNR
tara:strand:+ start:494 stop:691 length:198 start_codon:yes stop_codon:yes gene_type:complete